MLKDVGTSLFSAEKEEENTKERREEHNMHELLSCCVKVQPQNAVTQCQSKRWSDFRVYYSSFDLADFYLRAL